jgi:hypothetical protein|tara:strand:- start:391 stop:1212 length:822 start_codon:yes stop_codon:yes gene_type:complete
MGWQDWLGINQLDQNFNYTPQQAQAYRYDTQGYDPTMAQYSTSANQKNFMGQLSDQSKFGFNKAKQFFDPGSQYYKDQRGFLTEDLGESVSALTRGQNAQLAQRGMGGGGLGSLLGASNQSRVGEQVRQGMRGIQATGLQAGVGALGVAGQAASAGGQMATADASMNLQKNLANQSASNAASQFGANWANKANQDYSTQQYGAGLANQSAYNAQQQYTLGMDYQQAVGNRDQRASFANSMIGLFGGMGADWWGQSVGNKFAKEQYTYGIGNDD